MINKLIYLVLAFVVSAILGKIAIPVLKKYNVDQSERLDGPRAHLRKRGTPTMGGIILIITMAIFMIAYCICTKSTEFRLQMIVIALVSIGYGFIGFVDDYKKVVMKNTDGLKPSHKMFGLIIISCIYIFILQKIFGVGTEVAVPFINQEINLPIIIYVIFTIFVLVGSTNAVNLTDGIDGLAASVSTIMCVAIAIFAMKKDMIKYEPAAIFLMISAGACMGFLIYNFYKAKVMMGDTGSLLLGGVISTTAIFMKEPFILVIIAIIPIVETLSDIIQVLYYRKTGKRVLKMAPLHHHLELSGWRENKIVAVFSFITFVMSAIAVLFV